MKKFIKSSLFILCTLIGTSPANAMLKSCLKLGGLGVAGIFGKKYLYDPLKTQIKYRKYRAPQDVQKLSDQLLDDHLKTEEHLIDDHLKTTSGISKTIWRARLLKKKLLAKYLKAFGYNRVYILDPKRLCESYAKTEAVAYIKGGIFIHPDRIKNKDALVATLGHETCHQHRGDVTCKRKFSVILAIFTITKHILRNKNLTWKEGSKIALTQLLLENEKMEFLNCRRNIKTLFYSGYFGPLCSVAKSTMAGTGPRAYRCGRLVGLQEIVDKNPNHPFVIKLRTYREALAYAEQSKLDLEQMNAKTENKDKPVDNEKPNPLLQATLSANKILWQAEKDLETVANQMDIKAPKPETDL